MKHARFTISFVLLIVLLAVTAACSGSGPAAQQQPAAPAQQAPAQQPAQKPAAAPTQAPPAAPAATAVPPVAAAPPTQAVQAPTAAVAAAGQPVKGGKMVVSHGQNVSDTLNQHISNHTLSRMVAKHVLDTLTAVNPKDGSIHPFLAESWELSPDGKTYTFKLRKDVKFHDGTPFNAAAVKANFEYTMKPDTKRAFAYQALGADKFDKVEVVDDSTVKVSFKAPHPSFLINLSDGGLGIDSPTAMEKAGQDYGVKALVGSGPFKFKEWVKDSHITLVRNDDYKWGPSFLKNRGAPYLDELVYRDVQDVATRIAALEAGELHLATMTEPQVAQVKGNKDVQVLTTPKAGTVRMYLMNTVKGPTADLKVRQAMNYAIDKKALLQLPAWSNIGSPAVAPLPGNMVPGGDVSSLKSLDYAYDPEKAKALLEEAGWKVGADGIRTKDGQQLVLDMVTTAASVSQVEPVDQMLRKVGAKLNIRTGDFNFWIGTTQKGDFHMTLMSDSGYNGPAMVNQFFRTGSAYNWYGYSNPTVDQAMDAAMNATNQKDVWDNVMKAQAQVIKDAVGVMGWEQLYVYGARANVRDVEFNEVGFPFFGSAWVAK